MTATLKINDNLIIGENDKSFVIAEIGQNHQGSLETAKKLIKVAKECGVDCVKFQKSCLDAKFNKSALDRPYTSAHSFGATYGEHKQFLEFTDEQFVELQQYAKSLDILFTASAMDVVSLDFLLKLDVPFVKIGSGDVNNLILIEKAAQSGKPLIISTGMAEMDGVKKVYDTVSKYHKNFALLHCISSYPTDFDEINLSVIQLYQREFPDIVVGYSGHEVGLHITLGAIAFGAKIIERHLTLDKSQKGSDHSCSLEPDEMRDLVENIRSLEQAIGEPQKVVQESEAACYEKLGKTVVVKSDLPAGHVLTRDDLDIKVAEPKGIDGARIGELVGKTLRVAVKADQSLMPDFV